MTEYIDRLTEEWLQHGKIIVAVDFDDTICPWKLNDQAKCDKVIHLLKDVKLVGAYVVVFTACSNDRYQQIIDYCTSKELPIDTINRNPIDLPYGNQNKLYANIFIDDRAGLNEAMAILQEAMYKVRAANYGRNLSDQTVEF